MASSWVVQSDMYANTSVGDKRMTYGLVTANDATVSFSVGLGRIYMVQATMQSAATCNLKSVQWTSGSVGVLPVISIASTSTGDVFSVIAYGR